MVDMIVQHTNEEGHLVYKQWNENHPKRPKHFNETTPTLHCI
jgi:hypothetical protein